MAILEKEIKAQLAQYLELLEQNIVLKVHADDSETGKQTQALVDEIAEMSPKISVEVDTSVKAPGFAIAKVGEKATVAFAGLPLGHEFTSLVMALLQVSGRAPKVDEKTIARIKTIDKPLHFETFVSLSCHNCPEVVQALNIMSVVNPNISHTMIEGSAFQQEVEARGVMAVPTIHLNGENFIGGRITIEEILNKLIGEVSGEEISAKDPFDVLVVGAGPAGASAAIYAARKNLRTGIVSETLGGQTLETLGIENLIGTKYTEGPKLAAQLEEHINEYNVDVMKALRAVKLEKKDMIEVTLSNGAVLKSKTAILSTGARWRDIGIPGEEEFKAKGIAYCPHCDGPIFAGKDVAVVGGGNSGVEAAIDLAGVVNHVTVLEYNDHLKADEVLQTRLHSLPNVTVLTNVRPARVHGKEKVEGIEYEKRDTGEMVTLDVAGIFVLIGLMPNTEWLKDTLVLNANNEIVVDKHGSTSIPGVFAAGDCTDSAYKQIIISMGSGATASLGAFDYLIRN